MIDVTVDVSVGEQPQEVKGLPGTRGLRHQLPPGSPLEKRARSDRGGDELCALVVDTAAAECVVPHLAVAHVGVARHADRATVGEKRRGERVLGQPIEGRRARQPHRVRSVAATDPHPVHDTYDHRARDPRETRMPRERAAQRRRRAASRAPYVKIRSAPARRSESKLSRRHAS